MARLRDRGVRFVPNGRRTFPVNGRPRFWGGRVIDTSGGGPGLVDASYAAALSVGVDVCYESRATSHVTDDDGVHGLRLERSANSTVVQASSVEGTECVDRELCFKTLLTFNAEVDTSRALDATIKYRRTEVRVSPSKSNWARAIDTPPFEAYAVTCGITFTFGGLHISADRAEVPHDEECANQGLYAAGELIGGHFSSN